MCSGAESLRRVPLVVAVLLRTPVHALHVSSYQLLRGDAMPTAADRQLRRGCEQALRSDSSSVDAQLGALAAHPLAVEMAHVGEQGRRVRRFWLPRGLSASVEELEVEVGCQVDAAAQQLRPTGSPEASFSTGARFRLGAYPEPRLASANRPATAGEVRYVQADIAYSCSLPLAVAGGQPRALRVGGERRAEHLPRDRRPGERARQACARARLPSCNRE